MTYTDVTLKETKCGGRSIILPPQKYNSETFKKCKVKATKL
jgi:hypothetical protein